MSRSQASLRVNVGTALRTLQVHFPQLVEAKAAAQRTWRRAARKPFEPDFRILSALRLSGDDMLVDIGANRGQSIEAMRLFSLGAPIVAFEPNPGLASALQNRYAAWQNLELRPIGLGDAPGAFELVVPYYRGYMFDGLASFDEEAARSWLNAERIIGFDPNLLDLRRVTCRVETLDAQNLKPALMKLDVQGFELQVLKGGEQTLLRELPALIIEITEYDGIIPWLEARGYRRFAYVDGRLQPNSAPVCNTIFVHPDRTRGLETLID